MQDRHAFISKCKMPISVNRIAAATGKLLSSGAPPLIQYNGSLPQLVSDSRQPRHKPAACMRIALLVIASEE
jgi:hypothetical protein